MLRPPLRNGIAGARREVLAEFHSMLPTRFLPWRFPVFCIHVYYGCLKRTHVGVQELNSVTDAAFRVVRATPSPSVDPLGIFPSDDRELKQLVKAAVSGK
jgi:hypothetical protein